MAKHLSQTLTGAFAKLRVEVELAQVLAPVLGLAAPSELPWGQVPLAPWALEAMSLRWTWQQWLVQRRATRRRRCPQAPIPFQFLGHQVLVMQLSFCQVWVAAYV